MMLLCESANMGYTVRGHLWIGWIHTSKKYFKFELCPHYHWRVIVKRLDCPVRTTAPNTRYPTWPPVCLHYLRQRRKSSNKFDSITKELHCSELQCIIIFEEVLQMKPCEIFTKSFGLHKIRFLQVMMLIVQFCNRLGEFPLLQQGTSANVNSLEMFAHTQCDHFRFTHSLFLRKCHASNRCSFHVYDIKYIKRSFLFLFFSFLAQQIFSKLYLTKEKCQCVRAFNARSEW